MSDSEDNLREVNQEDREETQAEKKRRVQRACELRSRVSARRGREIGEGREGGGREGREHVEVGLNEREARLGSRFFLRFR